MTQQPHQQPEEIGTLQVFETVYDYIAFSAEQAGTSISEICRQAEVDRSVVERWKEGDPKSIQTFRKLQSVINALPNANTATV